MKYLFTLCLLCTSLFAATSKPVSYRSGDDTVNGILYMPSNATAKRLPAIVVIHEWWGLNDWVKEQAEKFADQGYVTLAIDLYRGKVATTPEEAHELMRGVPDDRAARDLVAAVSFLRSQKNINPKKIGAIGWCMGGGYALTLATKDPKLAADIMNYGHVLTEPASLKPIHAPILGLFGAKDQGIPPEDVNKFARQLKTQGKSIEVHIYPDAGHAFENPNNKAGYRADDAADAWRRQLEFFNKFLKK